MRRRSSRTAATAISRRRIRVSPSTPCVAARSRTARRREAGTPQSWRSRTERALRGVFAVNSSLERTAGVGRWYPDRLSLRRSFGRARLAASIGAHVHGPRSLTHDDRLGVYRLLAESIDRDVLLAFCDEQLGALGGDVELLETLRAFLTARGNKASCAKELFFHLNTVKYRLARIAELTGRDLDDAQALLDLHVALEIGDLLPRL